MATWPESDVAHMQQALAEARIASEHGEVPVGAVVVIDGEIVASGHNRTIAAVDPCGHAEIVALRRAAKARGNHRLPGSTIYVTLEPCPMCIGAMVQARIGRLVFGCHDPKAGAAGSATDLTDNAAFNHRFEVNGGVLADACAALLKAFFGSRR